MKAIKVTIEMGDRCVWSGYFINFPTRANLLSRIPVAKRAGFNVREFVETLDPKQWVISSHEPRKIVQFVKSFGVVVGKVEMEEVVIHHTFLLEDRR